MRQGNKPNWKAILFLSICWNPDFKLLYGRIKKSGWLTATSADLQPTSPVSLVYFLKTFPHWFFFLFCEVLTILVSTILFLPVILPLFLLVFLTGSPTAFSYNLTIFSDIWPQVMELGCIWARPWIPGRLTAEWGSSERTSRADIGRVGYSYREINTTGVKLSFWHKCLHPAQARNKNISSVALERKNPKNKSTNSTHYKTS